MRKMALFAARHMSEKKHDWTGTGHPQASGLDLKKMSNLLKIKA